MTSFVSKPLLRAAAVLRWLGVIVPMAAVVGSLCALFLWSLDRATQTRFEYPWLLFGLPVAGLLVGLTYHWIGRSAEGGNNQIHEPGGGVPLRMAPLILLSTVVTHLFGGSAGREGTAVQLGGAIASGFSTVLAPAEVRVLLMAGIAAGFGAVFGTPIAGAIFALEVLAIGRVEYHALIPCLVAAVVGDWTCHAWGIGHTHYHIAYLADPLAAAATFHIEPLLLLKVAVAGVAFGLVARLFSELSHTAQGFFRRVIPYAPLRPFVGGLLVIALVYVLGTREYLGLGVWSPNPADITITGFFDPGRTDYWSWLLKILFTVVTLSTGFKGGEVTPLFFIGAALGHALSHVLGAPTDLFAGLGFVALFAGAANTPLACMIMGIELFGATHAVYIAVACFLAYLSSGHSGIYLSQRVAVPKTARDAIPPDVSLRHVRELQSAALVPFTPRRRPAASTEAPAHPSEFPSMSYPHIVTPQEVGMVRIYLKPRDKAPGPKGFLRPRPPLYRELVLAARADGIMNAVAHHTHYGYSNHGKPQIQGVEVNNPDLTMCVELIGARSQLEAFCRRHGDLLKNKVIVYKYLEHWAIGEDAANAAAGELLPRKAG